jgi:hypothetical protein
VKLSIRERIQRRIREAAPEPKDKIVRKHKVPAGGPRSCLRSVRPGACCDKCGVRPDVVHSPLHLRGFFCARCCPVCSPPPEKTGDLCAAEPLQQWQRKGRADYQGGGMSSLAESPRLRLAAPSKLDVVAHACPDRSMIINSRGKGSKR